MRAVRVCRWILDSSIQVRNALYIGLLPYIIKRVVILNHSLEEHQGWTEFVTDSRADS